MKFWLNSSHFHVDSSGKCDGDCDCDCAPDPGVNAQLFHLTSSVYRGEIASLSTGALQQTNPLHVQSYTDRYWLACNPTGAGSVAVLDTQAYHLLNQFRSPRSLSCVQASMPEVAPERVAQAAAWLHRLGLLRREDQPDHVPPSEPEKNTVLTAWLHVTNICNLRCSYCYIQKTTEHMGEDTAMQAIDAVFRSARRHRFQQVRLKYAGGEPSLHMARVTTIHDYAAQLAQQHNMQLSAVLLTNGVSLSQRAIDGLKQRDIRVAISLDGMGLYHDSQRPLLGGQGSFKYIDATIRRLLENDVTPHISVTVSQLNLSGLPELLSYILDLGLSFSLSYYRDNDHSTDHEALQFGERQMIDAMRSAFRVIEHKLPQRSLLGSLIDKASMQNAHQRTCGVGSNYLVIDQHGKIAKCHANIKNTLTTISERDPLRIIREDRVSVQNLPVDEKEGCRTCDWRYWCGGGCPLLTHRFTGRYDVKSPNCNIYRALFPDALRLEGLRLLRYATPIEL